VRLFLLKQNEPPVFSVRLSYSYCNRYNRNGSEASSEASSEAMMSGDDVVYDTTVNICEAEIAARISIRQLFMVDAH
jgi:hypothetical protein